jgi:hypothetical protein
MGVEWSSVRLCTLGSAPSLLLTEAMTMQVNPINLIRRIPKGMDIPKLRDRYFPSVFSTEKLTHRIRLVKIISDYSKRGLFLSAIFSHNETRPFPVVERGLR